MKSQVFGGQWTEKKLDCLKKYLEAYRRIFSTNERAKFFITTYVDAFAGSGVRVESIEKAQLKIPEILEIEEIDQYKKGSPCIALEILPPFDKYLFIEKAHDLKDELENCVKSNYDNLSPIVKIVQADANEYLTGWCKSVDWKINRAVVFLDPYGMQVKWSLIEEIARTEAIDLWLLFPVGIGVSRLLSLDKIPEDALANSLTSLLGSDSWKKFYKKEPILTLFGVEDQDRRDINVLEIGKYIIDKLKDLFPGVVDKPLILRNSKNSPMYLLIFAAGNKVGSKTAVKIAGDIIDRRRSV